jgi:hypothetical protein
MAAALPRVVVINQTITDSEQVPTPLVTVSESLIPGSDFTYQSGPVPAQVVGYEWQWNPETGNVNDPGLADGFTVEAKSALLDGQGHVTEFYGGIAFGIAAAAGITCIVEFLKARRERDSVQEAAAGEDDGGAGDDPHPPDENRPARAVAPAPAGHLRIPPGHSRMPAHFRE